MITTIQSLSHDGRGVALIDNKTTFVSGALTGEKVRCNITRKHARYNEATVLEVLESSDYRVPAPCAHFGICGGCSLQHLTMSAQINLKQTTLLQQLKHFGKVQPEIILPPLTADNLGYRRKARLGVRFVIKKNKILVGFREKSGRYLADIQACPVLHPQIGERINELSALISRLEQYQQIPQIEVAVGDDAAALLFRHLQPLPDKDILQLQDFAKTYHFHIYLQPNAPAPLQKIWPEDNYHRLRYALNAQQIEMLFHPLDFTQVNFDLNRLMLQQTLKLLDLQREDNILDLFCGIGNFTLPIARHVRSVTGIEGSQEMVARASENAAHNHITNVQFFAANLQSNVISTGWAQATYDKILLDPPRTGAREILPLLASFAPKKIVYVSCNPATLARDAGELVLQHGFVFTQAGVMNMFPHTSHIEAIAVFEKQS